MSGDGEAALSGLSDTEVEEASQPSQEYIGTQGGALGEAEGNEGAGSSVLHEGGLTRQGAFRAEPGELRGGRERFDNFPVIIIPEADVNEFLIDITTWLDCTRTLIEMYNYPF